MRPKSGVKVLYGLVIALLVPQLSQFLQAAGMVWLDLQTGLKKRSRAIQVSQMLLGQGGHLEQQGHLSLIIL